MASKQRLGEMEFELALVGVLEDIYALRARADGDALNRRSRGYATLEFDYHCSDASSGNAKVGVTIRGVPDASFAFALDFGCSESILRAADECEGLALAIRDHVGSTESDEMFEFERRWED